jgi:ABC-type dipeptide/oligopeptide/nickel transport system permease component
MGSFLVRRVTHLVAVLIAVIIVVSVLLRLVPGDPVDAIMAGNPGMTAAEKTRLRQQLGLDAPLASQIMDYAKGLARGDLGDSLRFRTPARPLIVQRLGPTAELTLFAMIVAVLIAVPLGIVTAVHRDRPVDLAGSTIAVLGISVPGFLLGILLILLFAVHWRIFPTSGYGGSVFGGLRTFITSGDLAPLNKSLRFIFMPGITLGIGISAYSARIIRSSMVEVLRQDYVRLARAKGLPERIVILRHAFRNALIPVVTILGLQIGYLLSGAFIVENVFAWPGIGRFSVQAIFWRDYPVIQGVVMITSVIFLTINLLVDLLYAYLDPRIRLS